MNLKLKHHSIDPAGNITRSIVEDESFQTFRRFGGAVLVAWQERIHTGEFHNVLDRTRVDALETAFNALPAATPSQLQTW